MTPHVIGVLALQGGFHAHLAALEAHGHRAIEVRTAGELARCHGLVLPGGESTAQLRLLDRDPSLREALDAFARSGAPVLATCAGLILAAREVRLGTPSGAVRSSFSDRRGRDPEEREPRELGRAREGACQPTQPSFGWIDVCVRRNAYGRQLASAEAIADDGATELVLIRAPRIEAVGPRASIELTLSGEPVLVREGAIFGATYHPELGCARSSLYERAFGPA